MYAHEEFMQKEGITQKGFPNPLVGKIAHWNMTRKKYGDNPTPEQAADLRKRSVIIADAIADHLEKDLEEEDAMTEEQKQKLKDAKATAAQARTAKDWKAAIAAYKEGLAVDSEDADCKKGIAECEAEEKQAEADAETTRIEENYKILMANGAASMAARNWATARTAYNDALGIKNDDAHAASQLAKIAEEEGADAQKAEAAKMDAANRGRRATGVLFGGIYNR